MKTRAVRWPAGDASCGELLFDGNCRFCAWWIRYWVRLAGDRVRFRACQDALPDYPDLDLSACRERIHFRGRDGTRATGAEAAFRLLAAAGLPLWLWCYRWLPAYRAVSEAAYRFVSCRRATAARVSQALWGAERYPASYDRALTLFVRLLGAIYCCAFISLALQVTGLLGSGGILPATDYLDAARAALGEAAAWRVPTLFWYAPDDRVLVGACVAGAVAGALVIVGVARVASLLVCFVLYLSLFSVGQVFMHFQWDLLLLECGFLALFHRLSPRLTAIGYRLLLFRFMLLSGSVKLLSGDPSWQTLAALDFHYETQPLPSPLAWYFHQLPAWVDHLCVALTLAIELLLPFLIFAPRRPRMLAAAGFIVLETVIALAGNYNFFNLLTLALVIMLFDDAQFGVRRYRKRPLPGAARLLVVPVTALVLFLNAYYLARPFVDVMPAWSTRLAQHLAPFAIVNGYGLFAVMTTTRPEIDIQGSRDGRQWQSYVLRYKPGAVDRQPPWNVPHQPRLDWQLWFAALGSADRNPWFTRLLERLLHGRREVTQLFAETPFAAAPPRYVRALLWTYRFTTPAERRRSGAWWVREAAGLYYPAVQLSR